jgi:hypothetical protein
MSQRLRRVALPGRGWRSANRPVSAVVKDHRCSRVGPALAVQVSRLLMVVTDPLVVRRLVGRVGEI